ncbi:MAG: type II secretion system F family protein [Coprococcus comes]
MSQKTWVEKPTEATSEAALIQQLRKQELFLVESKNLTKVKEYKKLKAKQLAAFCRELSTLLASGVSLVRAMDILVDQEGLDPKEKEIYKDVLLDLRKGVPLSEERRNVTAWKQSGKNRYDHP